MDVDGIYTDYSKVFDTVSHLKLLQKLDGLHVGIHVGQTMIEWLKDF